LHPHADAEEGPARAGRLARQVVESGGPQGLRAAAEVADPGQDHARGLADEARVGGEPGVGPHPLEALLGRPQVADAVVEDGDEGRGWRHSTPLVDGTPVPSIRTASRQARATAFTAASMMWWVLRPRTM